VNLEKKLLNGYYRMGGGEKRWWRWSRSTSL